MSNEKAEAKTQREVRLNYRDLKIAYEVDMKSVKDLAEYYQVDWVDMKAALRRYNFIIRNNEPKPDAPIREYFITLVDTDRIVAETPVKTKTAITTAV